MRREPEASQDNDANHRALRRCHGCGSYARPYDELNGVILCERCARKVRRDRSGENQNDRRASIVA